MTTETPVAPALPGAPGDRTLLAVAGAMSAGAGVVHVGLAAEHGAHHWSMGLAFLLTGWAQLAWPVAAWLRPQRPLLQLGGALHLAAVAGLVLVSLVGWPLGPLAWQPEQVTSAALLCLGLELAVVGSLVSFVRARVRLPRAALPVALAAAVLASTGAVALGGGAHSTAGAAGHSGTAAPHGHGEVQPGSADASRPEAATTVEAETAGAGDAAETGHAHGPAETGPPTKAQRAAADALLTSSRAALKRYELVSVAEAEGYSVVHDAGGKLLHYAHSGYVADGRTLDPQRIESLLYVTLPGGGMLLVGGMYMMPKGEHGPAVGGSLTQWHAHDDLCLDPTKGIAITQRPGGGCPPGSAVGETGEMMHVWAIDYPGGPFGELEPGALRSAVRAHYGLDEQAG